MINSGVVRAHNSPPHLNTLICFVFLLLKASNKSLNSLVWALLFRPCKAQAEIWRAGGFSEAALVFWNDSALLEAQITADWTHRSPLIPPSPPQAAALPKPGSAPRDQAGSPSATAEAPDPHMEMGMSRSLRTRSESGFSQNRRFSAV